MSASHAIFVRYLCTLLTYSKHGRCKAVLFYMKCMKCNSLESRQVGGAPPVVNCRTELLREAEKMS